MDTPIKPSGEIVNNKWDFNKFKADKMKDGKWKGGDAADPQYSTKTPFAATTKPPFR